MTTPEHLTAANFHDWASAPPRLQARDVARAAQLQPPLPCSDPAHAAMLGNKTVSERAAGPRSGSKSEPSVDFDALTRLAKQERHSVPDRSGNAAAQSPGVRYRESKVVEVDERHVDECYAVGVTILDRPYTVELCWQRLRLWYRWLVVCPQCEQRKRYLVMAGESLICAKCAGVRARASHLPPILRPVAALSRAEKAQMAARAASRRRGRLARAAGAAVFDGRVTVG